MLKALCSTSWGPQKETLLTTYKAIGKSVLSYAAPVWTPSLKKSNIDKLQTAQNSALRIATGCHKMSDPHHLHQEAKVLPVKEHSDMLSAQYLASCYQPNHPCHDLTLPLRQPRPMKHTITSRFLAKVSQLIAPGQDGTPDHRKARNRLHTSFVQDTVQGYRPNKVLNSKPPAISDKEKSLPRRVRCTLSQLRSGYSKSLRSYVHRLKPGIRDTCPHCRRGPHDTNHLFHCTSKPVQLNVMSLWNDPIGAAMALELLTPEEELTILRS